MGAYAQMGAYEGQGGQPRNCRTSTQEHADQYANVAIPGEEGDHRW